MISKLRFVALALVAAAVAAPIAQAKSDPGNAGDVGFAQSYLQRLGLSPGQAVAWTTGVCSTAVRPSSCELTPAEARSASLGLARALLGNSGLSASQIDSWIQGVCSYEVKPASCYLTPAEAKLASERLAESFGAGGPSTGSTVEVVSSSGFAWGVALIGAGVAAGLLLIGAAGAVWIRRRRELAHG
jgi:hypothetical protein